MRRLCVFFKAGHSHSCFLLHHSLPLSLISPKTCASAYCFYLLHQSDKCCLHCQSGFDLPSTITFFPPLLFRFSSMILPTPSILLQPPCTVRLPPWLSVPTAVFCSPLLSPSSLDMLFPSLPMTNVSIHSLIHSFVRSPSVCWEPIHLVVICLRQHCVHMNEITKAPPIPLLVGSMLA